MANLRTNNLSGEQGQNAIKGSVVFGSDSNPAGLKIEDNSDLELSSETNWTIEFWLFLNGPTHGDYDVILGKGSATSNNYEYFIEVMSDNTLELLTTSTGSAWTFQQQISPVLDHDSWHHVAVVRNGSGSNTLKSYINGQEYGSFTAESIHISAYPFGVGYFAGGDNLFADVTVSNLRIVKGTSVYTANFTPPFHELTAIPNTVLLCCQDSDNPFKEETGKTITGKGRYEYLNDEEVVLNGTFDTDTSNWTTQGDTVEIDNQRLKIIRSGTFGSATQQIGPRLTSNTQYKFRGRIEQSGSPGSALIRLSQYGNGNGTIFYNGAYGTGIHETVVTTDSSPTNFWVSAIAGNGNVTGIYDDISVKAHDVGLPPKNIPPYGVDAGNTFGGSIKQSTEGYMYFPTGRTAERGRGRGVIMGGYLSPTGYLQDIYYVEIQSMGDAIHFGDLTASRYSGGGCGSSTRGLIGGGRRSNGDRIDVIESIEFAITSNSIDFGNLVAGNSFCPGGGNQTRGIWMGGSNGSTTFDTIQFVTIATKGDTTDFGNLRAASYAPATAASPTRMLAMGGGNPSSFFDYIDFVTIATTGDAQDFGDMSTNRNQNTGVSSNTRAVAMGGNTPSGLSNVMEFVTIATTGDATDFGDLTSANEHTGSVNNSIRGVQTGGRYPSYSNIMQFITIATTGNGSDFGDLPITGIAYVAGASDSHGGLS